jgi:uncharacterized Zn-binding protein involved in type VI secretion
MEKRIAVLGDATTNGGVIISGSGRDFCGNQGIALLDDMATCPKCKSTGKIIEGQKILSSVVNQWLTMVVLLLVVAP